MSSDDKERERIQKRRDEIGDIEIQRRQNLTDQAQEICFALTHHPNVKEAQSMLLLAEELRERLNVWTWGQREHDRKP